MTPKIAEAEKRAQPEGVPLGVLQLLDAAQMAKEWVRPTWDGLALPVKREIIASMFGELILGPCSTRLTVWQQPDERLDIVSKRITHRWREST